MAFPKRDRFGAYAHYRFDLQRGTLVVDLYVDEPLSGCRSVLQVSNFTNFDSAHVLVHGTGESAP